MLGLAHAPLIAFAATKHASKKRTGMRDKVTTSKRSMLAIHPVCGGYMGPRRAEGRHTEYSEEEEIMHDPRLQRLLEIPVIFGAQGKRCLPSTRIWTRTCTIMCIHVRIHICAYRTGRSRKQLVRVELQP